MIRFLTAGVKHALGLHRPGQKLPVRPDDILLAAYPDSGLAWLQPLVANLRHPDRTVDSGNLHRLIVDPDLTVQRDIIRAPRPRVIKSQGSFDPRYRRVIYMVRDPREVALAQYRGMAGTPGSPAWELFIERFVTGELGERYLGSWGENIGSWVAARAGHTGFHLLQHEDLVANPTRELARLAAFAGWTTTSQTISQTIEGNSVNKPAESLDWRGEMPEAMIARIETEWGDIMACLGYELVTRDRRDVLESSLMWLLTDGATKSHRALTT